MSWQILTTFLITCFFLSMTPGPNMLFSMGTGLRHGVRAAAWSGLGMCAALGAMGVLSALGTAALLETSATAFQVVKWAGVAYLAWLGIQSWRADPAATLPVATPDAEERPAPAQTAPYRLFLRGFLVCGANPKALLFMAAFFPQFLDASHPVAPQFAILMAVMLIIEFGWILTYAMGGRTLAGRLQTPDAARLLNRLTGGLLVGAGGLLAVLK